MLHPFSSYSSHHQLAVITTSFMATPLDSSSFTLFPSIKISLNSSGFLMDHKLVQARRRLTRSKLLLQVRPAVRSSSGLCLVRSWILPQWRLHSLPRQPVSLCSSCLSSEWKHFTLVTSVNSFQLVSTEKSLQWCHPFSEKKALLKLLALLFICLCKVHFALWFRVLFQILTLLTAFAKNSNITKSEWKWKTI